MLAAIIDFFVSNTIIKSLENLNRSTFQIPLKLHGWSFE